MKVYSDGASRGNPGPAAIAVKIVGKDEATLKRFSRFLGKRTNNEAEYEALIAALEMAQNLTRGHVHCFLDSKLVVKQLAGEYRVRSRRLRSLLSKVRELQNRFQKVSFNHVSRTDKGITEVDKLANCVLDRVTNYGAVEDLG